MSKTKQFTSDADKPRKKGSGGARPGAGRKTTDPRKYQMWLTETERNAIRATDKSGGYAILNYQQQMFVPIGFFLSHWLPLPAPPTI